MDSKKLYALACDFQIMGEIVDIQPFGEGHINSTFLVSTDKDKYILQRINHSVFKDIDAVMNNIDIVTKFIASKGKETIKVIPTNDGRLYRKSDAGYFRMMEFVKNTVCYQKVDGNLKLIKSEGEAFGELHQILKDIPVDEIRETIPDFHNTYRRYLNFLDACNSASDEKLKEAKEEVKFLISKKDTYSLIYDEMKKGNIKKRVIHNDTKINNILFDKDTDLYRCVIDLDTLMPGSVLFDIGDAFRGLYSSDNEDNEDTSLLKVDIPMFETFVSAYLDKMINELSETEIKLIPFSIYLMTIECGLRFLEDYFRGNVYFHVDYEKHNLVRARTQIALAKDVLLHMDELNEITKRLEEAKR